MKKLLFIFLVGQLLLLSYIFNKSVYDIYELNNLGDNSLEAYIMEDFSGSKLNQLYNEIDLNCLSSEKCNLQIIKTPLSNDNSIIYDIYHSDIKDISQFSSIDSNNIYNYYNLTKDDFVDNNGVFYTDIDIDILYKITNEVGIKISPYNNKIEYTQIINLSIFNFIILILLTQLVLFIYTFTRIKINAVKKMLGYSGMKMIVSSLKSFLYLEVICFVITIMIHFGYYLVVDNVISRYFYLLTIFLIIIVVINLILLFFTQISLKFIDISLMIKNKIYSNTLNYFLYAIKIILILSITVSVSNFYIKYKEYSYKSEDLEQYRSLLGYYTSNGYNADEDSQARRNPELMVKYGNSILELYSRFDKTNELYVNDAYILELLTPEYLISNGLSKEDIYNSIEDNYLVINERYVRDFMEIKDTKGIKIEELNTDEPLILVPLKYKVKESEIKKIYLDKYNTLLNYNELYGISNDKSQKNIDNINIIYVENNQKYELLGQSNNFDEEVKVKDPILIIDQGNFGSLYYYDLLNAGDLYFKLKERNQFSYALSEVHLEKLVNVGTLLTPYMNKVHNVEFLMYNSLVFTVLFLFTLLFVIYISNYVDVIANNKRYAIQYIHGYSSLKIFKSNILINILLIGASILHFFVNFNIIFYIFILIIDFIVLLYFYKKIIKKDINKNVKGG